MRSLSFALVALGLALTGTVASACPWGTHPGYDGRYCWSNRTHHYCPPGEHRGYDDRFCWRNGY